ncbi:MULTISPECIES: hypothetical protein [Clostridium]|uniref:hypothetical protein n=1 Tax=Clostridium TaxID=1485 RepID=UPI00232C2E29|nr:MULTISPECIES: hypothetical protein [Clostridium]MDB1942394.1 hypothetical protein [Clostridium tertium]MDU1278453.1 hypothetical protein [Clostridium sp.]MDU3549144.1 hypothetical protein [Clostridium sp.]MDU7004921.1 hypothetical protein [Clostridium sp.]MDU7088755.1 hypothetical protein [Clostridium sp.]
MNKKLFLKLGLLLLSLSLVACGQKNNSVGENNYSELSTSQFVTSTQSSVKESEKTTSLSVENAVESKKEDEDVQKNIQQDTKPDTQPEATEKEYYDLIKEAWQKQKDYIDSIDDPKVKQSVQTTNSAAILKSNELLLAHPEDSEAINASLEKVLSGE